jgi:hypothetical protein
MAVADAPAVPRRRRVGLLGHVALWFAGSWLLPVLVLFALLVAADGSTSRDLEPPGISPFAGAFVVALYRFPRSLAHLAASLLCGGLIHGFSARWRGGGWTLGGACIGSLALLIPGPGHLSREFVFASMDCVVPLALAPLAGLALLRRGEPPAPVLRRVVGTLLALALGGWFGWECHRAWWFEPRWQTLEATVGPVGKIVEEIRDRPDFRGSWSAGSWGGRPSGWTVPIDGRHSLFSETFGSGEVTAELRWDLAADRPEIVVGGVASAPATALTERLAEVAPSRGWTIRRVVDAGRGATTR